MEHQIASLLDRAATFREQDLLEAPHFLRGADPPAGRLELALLGVDAFEGRQNLHLCMNARLGQEMGRMAVLRLAKQDDSVALVLGIDQGIDRVRIN